MNYKIIVSPIASKNIKNAVSYYVEEVSKKVANDFIKDLKKNTKPYKKIRFASFTIIIIVFLPFSKFPYIAFFIVDEPSKTVFLNAVFHTSQNPEKYPLK